MNRCVIMFVLLIFCISGFEARAQEKAMKWGKLTDKEIKMTAYEFDYDAPAVVLSDEGKYDFDVYENRLRIVFSRHVRIKVFSNAGKDYAKVKLSYNGRNRFEQLLSLRGQALRPLPNGKIAKSKVKGKHINTTQRPDGFVTKEFVIPDVEPGTIIEYSYKITSLRFVNPKPYNIQGEIPVIYSRFRLQVPEPFTYITVNTGSESPVKQEQDLYSQLVSFKYYYYGRSRTASLSITGKEYEWIYKHVPALKPDKQITTMKDYQVGIKMHLAKVERFNRDIHQGVWEYLTLPLMLTTKDNYEPISSIAYSMQTYPPGYFTYVIRNWDNLGVKILNDKHYGIPLIKQWGGAAIIDNIIRGKNTEEEKLKAIYTYVQSNFAWNGVYSNRVRENLKEVYDKKSGTATELNFILIGLLNLADIETKPALISTRDNGRINGLFPVKEQFNHTIAAIKINNEYWFVDAHDKNCPINILPANCLVDKIYLVDKIKSELMDLNHNTANVQFNKINLRVGENLLVSGKSQKTETGQLALKRRNDIETIGETAYIDAFLKANDLYVDHVEVNNLTENDSNLIIKTELKAIEMLKKEGENYVLDVFAHFADEEFPFKRSKRFYPVDFNYPYEKYYDIAIVLPENLQAGKLPENLNVKLLGEYGEFDYFSKIENNILYIQTKIQLNKNHFQVDYYQYVWNFFNEVFKKLEEPVVLTEKSETP